MGEVASGYIYNEAIIWATFIFGKSEQSEFRTRAGTMREDEKRGKLERHAKPRFRCMELASIG